MTIRPIDAQDMPILEAIYNEQNLSFDGGFPRDLQHAYVVVDEQDRPFMLAGVKMVPELLMICDQKPHVAVRLRGFALLHETLRKEVPRGAFAFVCPTFSKSFVTTMMKRFQWKKTWESYRVT